MTTPFDPQKWRHAAPTAGSAPVVKDNGRLTTPDDELQPPPLLQFALLTGQLSATLNNAQLISQLRAMNAGEYQRFRGMLTALRDRTDAVLGEAGLPATVSVAGVARYTADYCPDGGRPAYRITERAGDNRVATCYAPENALLVAAALNAYAAVVGPIDPTRIRIDADGKVSLGPPKPKD